MFSLDLTLEESNKTPLLMDPRNPSKNRGFAFVQFEHIEGCERACRKGQFHNIDGHDVEVKRAVLKPPGSGNETAGIDPTAYGYGMMQQYYQGGSCDTQSNAGSTAPGGMGGQDMSMAYSQCGPGSSGNGGPGAQNSASQPGQNVTTSSNMPGQQPTTVPNGTQGQVQGQGQGQLQAQPSYGLPAATIYANNIQQISQNQNLAAQTTHSYGITQDGQSYIYATNAHPGQLNTQISQQSTQISGVPNQNSVNNQNQNPNQNQNNTNLQTQVSTNGTIHISDDEDDLQPGADYTNIQGNSGNGMEANVSMSPALGRQNNVGEGTSNAREFVPGGSYNYAGGVDYSMSSSTVSIPGYSTIGQPAGYVYNQGIYDPYWIVDGF